jgi:hypothetical protein
MSKVKRTKESVKFTDFVKASFPSFDEGMFYLSEWSGKK